MLYQGYSPLQTFTFFLHEVTMFYIFDEGRVNFIEIWYLIITFYFLLFSNIKFSSQNHVNHLHSFAFLLQSFTTAESKNFGLLNYITREVSWYFLGKLGKKRRNQDEIIDGLYILRCSGLDLLLQCRLKSDHGIFIELGCGRLLLFFCWVLLFDFGIEHRNNFNYSIICFK